MSENIRFYLNLQMVADEMKSEIPDCVFIPGEDETCLRGVCFYRKGIHLEKQYVYIIREQDIKGETVPKTHCSLIILWQECRNGPAIFCLPLLVWHFW